MPSRPEPARGRVLGLSTAGPLVRAVPLRTTRTPAAATRARPARVVDGVAVVGVPAGTVGAARERRDARPPAIP